ncbi:DEKNAAC100515 [Brettanomyces naardenensis]|uniref:DEKNAAC100515 n=1 Tax=Brettanomyces naardenensis TaxID=13370 RepID=A0A448YGB0_BRENA|nr:DEKNAAC100515 [Brettanomyces naardenensis]
MPFSGKKASSTISPNKSFKRQKRSRWQSSGNDPGGEKQYEGGRSDKGVAEDDLVMNSIKIHPLLQGSQGERAGSPLTFDWKAEKHSVKDPVKSSNWKSRKGFIINPYLDQSSISAAPERTKRLLEFNPRGKYIEQAEELREKWKEEEKEKLRQEELKSLNLVPDEKSGEQYYAPMLPPGIEWWDRQLVKGGSYKDINNLDNLTYRDPTDEENPITSYIQHPVTIPAPWEKNLPLPKPLFLTKKETKRLRKNERLISMRERQDKIKLGLEPAPPPRIKLKNLMTVLTNETIKNPTEVEMRVKREVEQRKIVHDKMNKERELTKDQRNDKLMQKIENDRAEGCHSCIFKINRLVNPKHLYKVDINAKEFKLTGLCINLEGGMSLVIAEGGHRALKKYKRLLLRRIKWQENEVPKRAIESDAPVQPLEDLSTNSCGLIWEGELPKQHFLKWTIYDFNDEGDIVNLLSRYRLENYWRQAVASQL